MSGAAITRVVACAAAAAVTLAACGGVGDDTGDTESGSGGKRDAARMTTMGFGLPDEIAKVRYRLASRAIAPSKVKVSGSGFNEQQFLSAVAAGTPPDLVYIGRQKLGTYATKGTIAPMTKCVRSQNVDMSQYRKPAVEELTIDGELYGLPEFYSNRVLYINNTALESVGWKPSAVDTSDWGQLSEVAKKLTKRSGGKLQRIGFDPKIPEFLPLWAKANGADMISADGKQANLDDPRVIEALEFTSGLIEAQGGWGDFKAFRDSFDFFGSENQFATNQLGAFPMEDWYLNVLAENSPEVDLTVVPMKDRNGKPLNWATGSAWAITEGTEHYEQACEFVKTMTEASSWTRAAQARADARKQAGKPYTGTYTGNVVAEEKIFGEIYRPSDNPVFDPAVESILDAQDHAFSMPSMAAGAEFTTAWESAVNRVLSGKQDPETALKQAQKEAQQALDAAAGGR